MNDEIVYTPTEEQVRLGYALNRDNRDMSLYKYDHEAGIAEWNRIRTKAYAEFDRWLVEHDRAVAEKAWDEAREDTKSDAHYAQGWDERPNPYVIPAPQVGKDET